MKFLILSVIFLGLSNVALASKCGLAAKMLTGDRFISPHEMYRDGLTIEDMKKNDIGFIAVTDGLKAALESRAQEVSTVMIFDGAENESPTFQIYLKMQYRFDVQFGNHVGDHLIVYLRGTTQNIARFLNGPLAESDLIWAGLRLDDRIGGYLSSLKGPLGRKDIAGNWVPFKVGYNRDGKAIEENARKFGDRFITTTEFYRQLQSPDDLKRQGIIVLTPGLKEGLETDSLAGVRPSVYLVLDLNKSEKALASQLSRYDIDVKFFESYSVGFANVKITGYPSSIFHFLNSEYARQRVLWAGLNNDSTFINYIDGFFREEDLRSDYRGEGYREGGLEPDRQERRPRGYR